MQVQEKFNAKPTKRLGEFHAGEVFKYDGYWFMVINVDLDHIKDGWSEFWEAHIHNPLEKQVYECNEVSAVCLENGNFCFLDEYWYADDYGEATIEITITK